MNDLIIPNIKNLDKKTIQEMATLQAQDIISSGNTSPLAMYIIYKKIIEFYSTAIDKLKDRATDEGFNFNKQYSSGAKIEIRNTGDKLNYSSDDVYAELELKLKARKDLLNFAYKSPSTIFDEEGVEVTKVGVKTSGVESLFVSF